MAYTIKEAAERLGVSETTVRRRIKEGELEAQKVPGPYGEQWEIPEDEINQAAMIEEVVPVQKHLQMEELVSAFERALENREQKLKEQIEQVRKEQEKRIKNLEDQLKARDKDLMETIRKKQENDPPLWERIRSWFR